MLFDLFLDDFLCGSISDDAVQMEFGGPNG